MTTARRAYLYVAAAIALQVLTWGTIGLLRNLALGPALARDAIAFQLAVTVVALPIYLAHWRAAQRTASSPPGTNDTIRRTYLFGMMALFVIPITANAHGLLVALGSAALGLPATSRVPALSPRPVEPLLALIVLGALAAYHARLLSRDRRAEPESGANATVRRVFLLGFSAFGALLTAMAAMELLTVALISFGGNSVSAGLEMALLGASARAVVGLSVWVAAWVTAQNSYRAAAPGERDSSLRKAYLYGLSLASLVAAFGSAVAILTGLFRILLGVPVTGQPALAFSILVVAVIGWGYHTRVIAEDVRVQAEELRQVSVRRTYRYLVTAAALAAALVGTAGLVQVIVRGVVGTGAAAALSSQFAWSVALVIVAVGPWLIGWRGAQAAASADGQTGAAERRSTSRRLHLYFYLLVATVIVLAGAVYVVYAAIVALLDLHTGADAAARLAEAIGYAMVGILVWALHGRAIRDDERRASGDRAALAAASPSLVLVDATTNDFGLALERALRAATPGLPVTVVRGAGLSSASIAADPEPTSVAAETERAGHARPSIVVVPWPASLETARRAETLGEGGTRIIGVVRSRAGWHWAGTDVLDDDEAVRQVVHAVHSLLEGDDIGMARRWTLATAIGAVLLGLAAVLFVIVPLSTFVFGGGALLRNLFQ